MLRHSLIQTLKATRPIPAYRTLTTSTLKMGEGDTGSMRSGGAAQGDAFTKREQASEDYYVRQQEQEKLRALKAKIAGHQEHLKALDKDLDDALSGKTEEKK